MKRPAPKAERQLLPGRAAIEAADWIRLRARARAYLLALQIETDFPQVVLGAILSKYRQNSAVRQAF